MSTEGVTRRNFVKTTGGAALGALAWPAASGAAQLAGAPRRYAIVGTGVRGVGMWGRPIVSGFKDAATFVGLCDTNPLRLEAGKRRIGADCPTYTNLDQMLDTAKPDLLMVTTVDATHSACIINALERGIDVATEKPMVIDEAQCQAVLDAERRTGKKVIVTFNYRYAPKHQRIKELLMAGEIGQVTSVDFSWYLDTSHGADYFRRWHRLRNRSGSLWYTKRPTTSISSTGGSMPIPSRSPRRDDSPTTARMARSVTRRAVVVLTPAAAATIGTSHATRNWSTCTSTPSLPMATSATAACSKKMSTSSTR